MEQDAASRLGAAASVPERWLGRQCPPRALHCLLQFIGAEDTSCRRFVRDEIIRETLRSPSDAGGAIATVFRRDALCLTVGPAPEKVSECYFIYRYIARESCSQFDSLPRTCLILILISRSTRTRRLRALTRTDVCLLLWCGELNTATH